MLYSHFVYPLLLRSLALPYFSTACSSLPSIVISFIFYYFVNSLCRTLVQPAARCLILKVN
ncbi:hypothetical protein E4T79_00385 [Streptococcus sp. LYSM12]|nr:hypothetical protein E4T79_00385 [Streptococcus sp. LYSM12]